MIISVNAQRILKILHLLAVCFWVGGYLTELVLYYGAFTAESGDELFGFLRGSRFVSVYVVVYLGAWGSFFTGLAYSLCTNRGFFRHKWIVIKWASTVYLMCCGGFALGPLAVELLEMAQGLGLDSLSAPEFQAVARRLMYLQLINFGVMIALVVISVFKPWEVGESIHLLNKKLGVER